MYPRTAVMIAHDAIKAGSDAVRRFGKSIPNILAGGATNAFGEGYARIRILSLNPNLRETFRYFCVGLCITPFATALRMVYFL